MPSSVPDGRVVRSCRSVADAPGFPGIVAGSARFERGSQRTARPRAAAMARASRSSRVRRSGARGHRRDHRATSLDATIGPPRESAASARPNGDGAVGGAFAHRPVRSGHDPLPPGMAPASPLRPRVPWTAVAIVVLAVVLAACGCRDPGRRASTRRRACTTDGRSPARTRSSRRCCRRRTRARRPTNVDSGRNCTPAALGTLADAGHRRGPVRGRDVALGGTTGLTVAVFEGDGLDADGHARLLRGRRRERRPPHREARRPRTRPSPAQPAAGWTSCAATARARPSSPGRRTTPGLGVVLAADLGDAEGREAEALARARRAGDGAEC